MTVNAHTGYGELPMNPSCTMKLRLPMKIAVQRAQPAPGQGHDDSPEEGDPAPCLDVEHDDRLRRQHVVLASDDGDQTLEGIDRADDDHQPSGETDPPAPSTAIHCDLPVNQANSSRPYLDP